MEGDVCRPQECLTHGSHVLCNFSEALLVNGARLVTPCNYEDLRSGMPMYKVKGLNFNRCCFAEDDGMSISDHCLLAQGFLSGNNVSTFYLP